MRNFAVIAVGSALASRALFKKQSRHDSPPRIFRFLAALALSLAASLAARAVPVLTLQNQFNNGDGTFTYNYALFNNPVSSPIRGLTLTVGGQFSHASFNPFPFLFQTATPFDSNNDGISDGNLLTFEATNPGAYVGVGDSLSISLVTTASTTQLQQATIGTTEGSYFIQAQLPYFQSTVATPDAGSPLALLLVALAPLAYLAKRRA